MPGMTEAHGMPGMTEAHGMPGWNEFIYRVTLVTHATPGTPASNNSCSMSWLRRG